MRSRKIYIVPVLLIMIITHIFGSSNEDMIILNNTNSLMSSFVPIEYGNEEFMQRIQERTKGEREPIGLLLSGGSARAFAHIGVIAYIEELGIVPDYIISNSMGSIVGILYAAGLNSNQLYEMSKNLDVSTLFDMTLPMKGGLLDPSKFVSFVSSYIAKGKELQDLDIPIMVITEDIATKRSVRLMEGDIESILAASFALPVYFPPVEFRGHMLIDGGLINLAPVEIAYEYGDNVIVSSTFYEGKGLNLRDPLTVLNVSLDIGKRRNGAYSLYTHPEAVWIRCDVEDFSFMAFDKIDELRDKGYSSAKAQNANLLKFAQENLSNEAKIQKLEDFNNLHTSILNKYSLFNSVKPTTLNQQLFFGIKNFTQQKDQKNLLIDESIFGVRYRLGIPMMEFSVLGGLAWSNRDLSSPFFDMLLNASFSPLPFVMIEGDYLISAENGWTFSSYQRGEVKVRELLFKRKLLIEQSAKIEQRTDLLFAPTERLVDGGLSFWYRSEKETKINSRVSYQIGGDFDRQFFNSMLAFQTPIAKDFFIGGSYHGRYALDGGGDVPFYASDEYFSTSSSIIDQGRGGSANNANYLVTAALHLDWKPSQFTPSFSEALLLKESSMGVFGQLLWYEVATYTPYFLIGLQAETTLSLLGLKEAPLSLYTGYDSLSNGVVFGLNLGISTWN